MGCLTILLSLVFRLKHRKISHLPRNLSASIFDKTFNVFNPYPEHRRIIHNFISALPLIVPLVCLVFVPLIWKVFESGLFLSLVLLLVCPNLMLIEVASDTYQNARLFIKAFDIKADLGAGDLKVFQALRRVMPKLSNYYLVMSILFLTLAATLSYIWSLLLWSFTQVAGLILQVAALTGSAIGFQVAVFLFALVIIIIQILIWKIKSKLLSHLMEP